MDIPQKHNRLSTTFKTDANVDAWQEFVRFYCPVIYGFARKRGFQDAEATHLMQTILQSVANTNDIIDDKPKTSVVVGRVYSMTCNTLSTYRDRARPTNGRAVAAKPTHQPVAKPDPDWDLLYQRRLVEQAMDEIKAEFDEQSWLAFSKTVVDRQPPHATASELNMTSGEVCLAKCRVLSRLRKATEQQSTAS